MAKPVDHNIGSGIATIGSETAKGVVGGIVTIGLAGALLAGGIAAAASLLPFIAFSWTAVAVAGVVGGLFSGIFGAATGGTVGGIIGVFSGASRVAHEQTQYNVLARGHENLIDAKVQNAQVQQAYAAGAQDVIQQIQEQQAGAFAQREMQKRAQAAQAPANGKA